MAETILKVNNLSTSFFTDAGEVKAVNGVSFELEEGKVLGIVGESGSGKSVTAYSIMQILSYPGRVTGGEVFFKGVDLLKLPDKKMREFRGESISIIFQDPMTSLNPVYTIGNQLDESIRLHTDRTGSAIRERSLELLNLVGINDPSRRARQYPHELSGGMRQRVMIAMALACEPDILIADEPTTALDVTIQAQILELIAELQCQLGMAVIIITHDLGVIADMCDEIIVMYAGSVCERGTTDDIFYSPKHEYTKNLLRSIPKSRKTDERLVPIAGNPIDLLNLPTGCAFAPRCRAAMEICLEEQPEEIPLSPTQSAACWVNVKNQLQEEGKLAGDSDPDTEGGDSV